MPDDDDQLDAYEPGPCDDLDYDPPPVDDWLDPYGRRHMPPSTGSGITTGLAALFRRPGRPVDPDDKPTPGLKRLGRRPQENTMPSFRRRPVHPTAAGVAAPPEPPRDYAVEEIKRGGWTPGAVSYVKRVLRDCADRGEHACLTEHFELVEMWEASATLWMERQAMLSTPEHKAWMAGLREQNRAAAAARRALAEAGR